LILSVVLQMCETTESFLVLSHHKGKHVKLTHYIMTVVGKGSR